jgi:predicted ATPase
LGAFYQTRGALPAARALGEQLDRLAQRTVAPTLRLEAHDALGSTLFFLGEYAAARAHLEQGIALASSIAQDATTLRYDQVPGVRCLAILANTLWCMGFPAQAIARSQEALTLAQALAHPHSLAFAEHHAAFLQHRCRDVRAVQQQSAALLPLATTQGFPLYAGFGACWQGWALTLQGEETTGIAQLRQGMAAVLATGQTLSQALCLVLLAEAMAHTEQRDAGLCLLAEALAACETSGRGDVLAEAHRLRGELLLAQTSKEPQPQHSGAAEAETCFQQALTIARGQQAKSWELRAAMSLSRLWLGQGKRVEAQQLLGEVYCWFTEGFDTPDLQEARVLLAL